MQTLLQIMDDDGAVAADDDVHKQQSTFILVLHTHIYPQLETRIRTDYVYTYICM